MPIDFGEFILPVMLACHSDSASDDAALLLRLQAMDETHGVTPQQTDVSHSNEQEASSSTSQEYHLYDLQTERVSDF